MQIAVDVTPLSGPRTGIARFVELLLEAIDGLPGEIRPDVVRYARTRSGDLAPGTRRLLVPAQVAVRTWARSSWPDGGRLLRRADVVHGTNFIAPPRSRPTVLTIHDCSFATAPEGCAPVVRQFRPVVERAVARGAWLHVPSQHVHDEAAEIFGTDRVVVVPHGPPEGEGTTGGGLRAGGPPFVLSIATEEPRKDLGALVAAFGAVAADDDEVELVLVGPPGADSARISAAIEALEPGARSRVHRRGFVDEGARRALLAAASVVAYPSLDEGFGFPVLEAQHAGTPVVTTRAGALPETAGDGAVLVPPGDVPALAGALDRVLHDDGVRASLAAAGRRNLTRFSWARTAERLLELYRQAASGGPRRPGP